MFKNAAKKLLICAKIVLFVGIGASLLIAVPMIIKGADTYNSKEAWSLVFDGIEVLFGGVIAAAVAAAVLYGLGHICEKTEAINNSLSQIKNSCICRSCGQINKDGSAFCTKCGKSLKTENE